MEFPIFDPPRAVLETDDINKMRSFLKESPDPFYTFYRWPVEQARLSLAARFPLDAATAAYCQWRSSDGAHQEYLPIELFRSHGGKWDLGAVYERFFQSSGTSSQQRSLSPYSSQGLALYRLGALVSFYHVLKRFTPDPFTLQGLSLVPSLGEWPHSSLATMMAWISELWPVTYVDEKNLPRHVAAPCFVFGTAFHYINAYDEAWRLPLPPGSLVFETGGTKGRSREVTRDELYEALSAMFRIPSARVVSEYGMCELASQAYDIAPREDSSLAERHFRFPAWVRLAVSQEHGVMRREGLGALVVDDPLRVDFPWPLRIQDMAELAADGAFRLRGRVPFAILKGCSLNVEDVVATVACLASATGENEAEAVGLAATKGEAESVGLAATEREATDLTAVEGEAETARQELDDDASVTGLMTTPEKTHEGDKKKRQRATIVRDQDLLAFPQALLGFLTGPAWRDALCSAFGSAALAHAAISDIVCSLPVDKGGWERAVKASGASEVLRSWLVLPPASHPVAILEPLSLGLLGGMHFVVKRSGAHGASREAENELLRFLSSFFPGQLQSLPASFRLGREKVPEAIEAIMVFGSDETIAQLRQFSSLPMKAYGTRLALAYWRSEDDEEILADFVKDAWSLGQMGCMSLRALLIDDRHSLAREPQRLVDMAHLAAHELLPKGNLSPALVTALDHEMLTQIHSGGRVYEKAADQGLFPVWELDKIADTPAILSQRPFVLPLVISSRFRSQSESLAWATEALPGLHYWVSTSSGEVETLPSWVLRTAGNANVKPWDGRHEGSSYFSL